MRPGTEILIDKQLIHCEERSKHTLQIETKTAAKGYKLYSICDPSGYLFDFLFSSKVVKVVENKQFTPTNPLYNSKNTTTPLKRKRFTPTDRVALTLVHRLDRNWPNLQHILYMDNFFTNHRLFSELRAWNHAACGTCKAGSGAPKELFELAKVLTKQEDYGLHMNYPLFDVNNILFVDSKGLVIQSTYHTGKEPSLWLSIKKRRDVSISCARSLLDRTVEIPLPQAAGDYNNGMGGVNLAQRLANEYTTAKTHFRN